MNKQFLCFTFFLLMYLTLPLTATAQVVDIPDSNLRAEIEKALGKASGATITAAEMATLPRLEARKRQYQQFNRAGTCDRPDILGSYGQLGVQHRTCSKID